MSEWHLGSLGDFITLHRGFDLPSYERSAGSVPIVSSSGISDYHEVSKVQGPGVVTGRYGTIGQVFFLTEDFWPLNTTLFVSDFKGNDPQFVAYFLKTIDFNAHNDKSSVPGVNRNHLHTIPVRFPPLPIQREIAHILGSLDDKIDLNRRMNATLEAMARALFKSWFVDFDPVRAKAEGRLPAGMDAETAALFPDSFEDSALGEIPRGWQVDQVGTHVRVVDYVANGSFASLKDNVTLSDTPQYALYVRSVDSSRDFTGPFKFVDQNAYKFLSKSALDGTETIISNVGANAGTVFRPPAWLKLPMTLGSNAVALKSALLRHYIYYHFSTETGQADIASIISGSAQPKFNKTDFRSLKVILPPKRMLDAFNTLLNPIVHQQFVLKRQSLELEKIRDALLPRLMSGELEGLGG